MMPRKEKLTLILYLKHQNIPKNKILIDCDVILFCVYQNSDLFVPPSFRNTLLRLMEALWVRIKFRPDLESLTFSSGMIPKNN